MNAARSVSRFALVVVFVALACVVLASCTDLIGPEDPRYSSTCEITYTPGETRTFDIPLECESITVTVFALDVCNDVTVSSGVTLHLFRTENDETPTDDTDPGRALHRVRDTSNGTEGR